VTGSYNSPPPSSHQGLKEIVMSVSLYEASIPTFLLTLSNLQKILEKAVAHAEARKFDPNVFVSMRLYPDMLPLARQVQIASDAAKGAAARLTGTEAPKFEDTEATMAELIARVVKTSDYLQSFKAEQFADAEERAISIKTPTTTLSFNGLNYLRHWALPNLFFHTTVAYSLLRHGGVEIGKKDYLGQIPQL
jgi:hypothetical protein